MGRSLDSELIALLQCTRCGSERLGIKDDTLLCQTCGHCRAIDEPGILREPSMEIFDPSSVYERETKNRYQSFEYASQYMQAYARPRSLQNMYSMFIAWRERHVVELALRSVASNLALVLDLPAGTGKLAPIHSKFAYRVIAADASAAMLRIGLGVWTNSRQLAGMVQTDVRRTGFRSGSIDCTVCLRLMHRLPADVANEALRELARITKRFLIVSAGIRSRTLSSIRKASPAHGVAPLELTDWHRRLAAIGQLQNTWFVARGVSKEVLCLVDVSRPTSGSSLDESRTAPAAHHIAATNS